MVLDGTSAACPTAAGVLTLVNDALIAGGRPPLGFLNPCLYERLHTAFTDVTSGSAVGCGGDGFPAKEGWDPVTGFGTPVSSLSFYSAFLWRWGISGRANARYIVFPQGQCCGFGDW